jgi:hypothetical protein
MSVKKTKSKEKIEKGDVRKATSKQFNEKPSKFKNIGSDIGGAQRHHFDTYENPEEAKKKAAIKREKNILKELKEKAILQLNMDNYKDVIFNYEFNRVAIQLGFEKRDYSPEHLQELRSFVYSTSNEPGYTKRANKYNRLRNLIWRLNS